jgi:hypothetical protein
MTGYAAQLQRASVIDVFVGTRNQGELIGVRGNGGLEGGEIEAVFLRLFLQAQFSATLARFEFAGGDGARGTGFTAVATNGQLGFLVDIVGVGTGDFKPQGFSGGFDGGKFRASTDGIVVLGVTDWAGRLTFTLTTQERRKRQAEFVAGGETAQLHGAGWYGLIVEFI